ncbi:uncharacterized protein DUF4019 [Pseudoduganella lurida]|uniref:Uncharacterized protein DUF4019 n=1 Tax=Pseudoduganella lurida TaxID=1036180 RepID=A0A562R7F0_9BURK|nr:DUF4019 domain-containing protein [Pseudoduganella lurida]TWI64306.1 uncharacterized protein DUF4019 [Pseudoduganella lurida]
MKTSAALLFSAMLSALFSVSSHAAAQAAPTETEAIAAAREAAQTWLALVDANQYAQSWQQAAAPLRNAISTAQWEKDARNVRLPFGAFQGREVTSATYSTTMPGVPKGSFVVIKYASRFADRANAVETVTPMLEPDGQWRVSGYFIR